MGERQGGIKWSLTACMEINANNSGSCDAITVKMPTLPESNREWSDFFIDERLFHRMRHANHAIIST